MGAMTALEVAAHNPNLVGVIVLEDPPLMDEAASKSVVNMPSPEALHAFQNILSLRTMSPEERLNAARKFNPNWDEAELGPWEDSKVEFDPGICNISR